MWPNAAIAGNQVEWHRKVANQRADKDLVASRQPFVA
jgi:hypothetical protein